MPEWTLQQKDVIFSESKKIICSAAAGSGKTAVMIERIVQMIMREDRPDPESFLVVTFTNAAAAEMKAKIRERLREGRANLRLRRALERLDLMEISTIHAFCQRLIRQEFQAAGADPFFAVCEQARAKELFSKSFRSACAALQKSGDPDYAYWKTCFSQKATEEIVRGVHTFMMSLPDPFRWLDDACDNVPQKPDDSHPWFACAAKIVEEKLLTAQMILRRQYLMFDEPEHGEPYRAVWKADSELFHVKQLWAQGESVPEEQLNAGFMRLPAWSKLNSLEQNWKERYNELRDRLKDLAEEVTPLIRPDPETVARDFTNLRKTLQGLKTLTHRTAEIFEQKKAKLRLLDFSDLEQYALKVLRDPEAGPSVRSRWTKVFVDECQDVSAVQDEIIQRLSSEDNHLFMVGDVKQSIYRFRLADPLLFQRRAEAYAREDSPGELLSLQTNFRSRPEILETANTIFRDVMRADTAEMDYTDREALIPGKKAEGYHPVQVDLLEPDEERKPLEIAADGVAMRARELLKENYKYRDMVLLLPRVSREGPELARLLEERGIPVFFDGGTDFYERTEVSAFLALLTYLIHPTRDEALLTVLKSAPFFFTEEELAQVRLRKPGKDVPFHEAFETAIEDLGELGDRCREVRDRVTAWRRLSTVESMSSFVRFVCSDSQHYAMAGSGPTGRTKQKNLSLLCRKAEDAEAAGVYTLHRFLNFVSEQAGGGDQRSVSPLAEGDDVVRILTMHKSKGLQFPVVFCLGLDSTLSHRAEGGLMTDAELGICLKYKRPDVRLSRDTAATQIFNWKKEREQRAERIRLLYVALTRAQERMVLVGVEADHALWHTPPGVHRVLSAGCLMDWIVPALLDDEKKSTGYPQAETPWKISVFQVESQKTVEKRGSNPQFNAWLDSLLSAPPVEDLWKDYPPKPMLSKMQKRSVTGLLQKADRDLGEEDEETPEDKRIPDRFSAALERTSVGEYPAFMAPPPEKRAAWRGTLIHRFLSLIDLEIARVAGDRLEEALGRMKEELIAQNVFTKEEGAVIDPKDAAAWLRSPLGQRMLAGWDVHREWSFNLRKPERDLLVQGIIDCAFREREGWILVDYKTDRITDEENFVEIYRPQLRWYAEAVRRLTRRPVKEAWLYSISKQKAFLTDAWEEENVFREDP